jgi:hypothetical protein
MKSPIIYYGGKTSMLPIIIPMIPVHKVYTKELNPYQKIKKNIDIKINDLKKK